MPRKSATLIPTERIEKAILLIRGEKVILDDDLAAIYGVTTKRLNQQVQRNAKRFPKDFSFVLTSQEFAALRLQNATSKTGSGGRRVAPRAFTEHGAVMAASILNTPVAVSASVEVVRVFVRLRRLLASHADLARKLEELERKYDSQFRVVFDAIRQLMAPPTEDQKRRRIGFHATHEDG